MKDFIGQELQVGDVVAKAERSSTIPYLELRIIQRIEDGRIYLQRPDSYEILKQGRMGYVPNMKKNHVACDPSKIVRIEVRS